jgi:hypothetical protein
MPLESSAVYISDKRLYLDKAGAVVGEKDPTRVELLINEGGKLPIAQAQKYGLLSEAEMKAVAPRENKAIMAAPENKSGAPESDDTNGRGYDKKALLSIAKERGINVPAKATKEDIVALLDAGGKEPESGGTPVEPVNPAPEQTGTSEDGAALPVRHGEESA